MESWWGAWTNQAKPRSTKGRRRWLQATHKPGAPWPRMAAGRFANEDQRQSGLRAPPTLTGRSAGRPLLATWTQRRREETPLVTWSPFLRLLREGKVRRHSLPSRALIIGAANQIRVSLAPAEWTLKCARTRTHTYTHQKQLAL